jgi:phosphatidate phosphatase APP1
VRKVDWQNGLACLVHSVEQSFDGLKYRLGSQKNGRSPLMIMPYLGFGSVEFIELKGRVVEDSGIKPSRETDRIWNNLLNMYRRFESDEVPFARVAARFQGVERIIEADEEGFFEVHLRLDQPVDAEQKWQLVELELLEPGALGERKVRADGRVLIISPQAEYGVISDIDDTVVHTGVTSPLRMARTVLLKNARTRSPLKGVANFYKNLRLGRKGNGVNPLFYVSSSPWNMYDLFQEFFQIRNIPVGPIFLRNWGFERQSMLAVNNRLYKLNAICNILEKLPDLNFILIGDSGEKDAEIYTEIIQNYPGRILAAYIRSVRPDQQRESEIQKLAEEVGKSGSVLVYSKDTRAMEEHAFQQGWIRSTSTAQPVE